MATTVPKRASVLTYDPATGLGTLLAEDGVELLFHATAIADGSRSIEVGVEILCGHRAGHAGTVEAYPVTPIRRAG